MRQAYQELSVPTPGRGFVDITARVASFLRDQRAQDGLLTVFIQHTSASLLIQENADPRVRADLEGFFARLVPDGDPRYSHDDEGPDDMPGHVRAALTQTSVSIPVRAGGLVFGTWQALYLYEHRRAPHSRTVALHYLGD